MSPRDAAMEVAREFKEKGQAAKEAGDHLIAIAAFNIAESWAMFAKKVTDRHYHGDGHVWSPSDVDYV